MQKAILITLLLFPLISRGQAKECYKIARREITMPCILVPSENIADTIVSIIPSDCNFIKFDSFSNGIWRILTADSILFQITTLKNGKRNGLNYKFYYNGSLKEVTNYKNDQQEGSYLTYSEDGKIHFNGYTEIGPRGYACFSGVETLFWDNGQMAYRAKWINCRYEKDEEYWDLQGNIIDKDLYSKLWGCN